MPAEPTGARGGIVNREAVGDGRKGDMMMDIQNKVAGLNCTLRIEVDKRSVAGGDALALGACVQSLTRRAGT